MANSGIMTIFGEPEKAGFYPSSFVVSILLHAGFFSLLTARLIQTHHIIERFPTDRFAVRYVNFHSTEPQTRQASGGGIHYAGPAQPAADQSAAKAQPGPHAATSAAGSPAAPAVARITPKRMPASQTLIQPDIPPTVTISKKTTVPLVVLWTADKTTVKTVSPALPKTASIAVAQPSLETPIREENIADLKLSSSTFVTQGPAVLPSTTTPVVVHGPEELKKVPQTTSKQPEPPSPARIISLSDMRVADGKVIVPVANQTAKADPGALIPGQLKDSAPSGNGATPTRTPGNGTGKAAGDHAGNKSDATNKAGSSSAGLGNQPAKAAQGSSAQPAADHGAKSPSGSATQSIARAAAPGPSTAQATPQTGAASVTAQGAALGSGVGSQSGAVHISLPKDGQFGVVVFGSSVADQYPETAEMWSGRMASTVYLHVGLPKSWILQYALPRLAAASGEGHIDAPWPYEIARPALDPGDVNADAVILHGFVDKDGHFEKLEVVFPEQLTQAPTWVKALNQWQFRPAKQNSQPIPIEVLLIIPDQSE
jgi:hypothetical protein